MELHQLESSDAVRSLRAGTDALARGFRLPAAQAAKIADAEDETFMAIEELDLPSTTQLELNVAPAGQSPVWQAPRICRAFESPVSPAPHG